MKSDALGLDLIERAKNRFKDARRTRDEKRNADTVRYCQECVELSLKGALRLKGIEYPKKHDIGTVLEQYAERFSEWSEDEIEATVRASNELYSLRGRAMYGDEARGTPAGDLFGAGDADRALDQASQVLDLILRLSKKNQ